MSRFGATFKLPGHARPVACLGVECAYRPCLWVRSNPGTFAQGRGYRDATADLICGKREVAGCPTPLPPMDAEKVRCCVAPAFPTPKAGSRPAHQTCTTCRKRHEGFSLALARTLPATHKAVRCDHRDSPMARGAHLVAGTFGPDVWRCQRCHGRWAAEPKPHQAGDPEPTS